MPPKADVCHGGPDCLCCFLFFYFFFPFFFRWIGFASLRPLLLLQLLLLAFLSSALLLDLRIDPNTASAILAGMIGVSPMVVQSALVQASLKGAPSTAR